jgi:subtilisin-like proprotein convertase family protein
MRASKLMFVMLAVTGMLVTSAVASVGPGNEKYFKVDVNQPIPDNSPTGTRVLIHIPFDPTDPKPFIKDLAVDMIIRHTWQGDISVTLTHLDNGTSAVLMNRPGTGAGFGGFGFSTDNFGNPATGAKFTFTDNAQLMYQRPDTTAGVNNVAGPWRPENPLSVFKGKEKWGTWELFVRDSAAGDLGTVLNFGLLMQNVPEPATMALLGLGGLLMARRRMFR